jgi:hypothetical protein
VMSPATYMTGSRARNVLHKLERFNRPFLDTVKLTPHNRQTVTAGRRHLFTHMVRTGTAFWAWSKQVWIEVIEAAPVGTKSSGTRFWMINLAYLFCDFLYVGASTTYGLMASTLFGSALVEAEIEKLRAPVADIGYWGGWDRFHWLCALCMLINRHPSSERFSAQTIVTVSHLLPEVLSTGRKAGRQMLKRLQLSLCQLGILDEPAVLPASDKQRVSAPLAWRKDPTVDPQWIAWVCAFYEQTPYQHERTIRHMCNYLMLAGRWLKKTHPEIAEPTQWDETVATEYVAYTCRARRGDQALPSNTKYTYFQDSPQQLSPGGIENRLRAMRSFFSHLQRRPYTVNGKQHPKLQFTWLPREAFKMPEDVLAAHQPNPRDIAEDIWFKLIWAACTLTKEKLHAINRNPQYPLAYYRAACLVWVTAARRSDEIRRLGLGCVRREWAPEMRDEHGQSLEPAEELFYLRIPTNKMKVMRDNSVPVNPVKSDEQRKTPQEYHARRCCLPCGPAKSTTGVKAKTSAPPHSAPHLRGLDILWYVTSSPPGGDAELAAADGRCTTAGLAHGRQDGGTRGPSGDSSRKAPCPPPWWCYGLSFCASRRACSSARSRNSACREALR